MYFLGIDPGLSEVGFGIIESKSGQPVFVDCGIIKTNPAQNFGERLMVIKDDLKEILKLHPYAAAGMEEIFFVQNITNGISVAHARGVIYEEIVRRGLQIHEFKPREIKSNITGDGAADKLQLQQMVQKILNLTFLPRPHDAADALAIAILTSRMFSQ